MLSFAPSSSHLLSWVPANHSEVLFLSEKAIIENGKAIRGGVPICWPWFGNKDGLPSHGFARTNSWEIIEKNQTTSSTKISFQLSEAAFDPSIWDEKAELIFSVEEEDNRLIMNLITKNTSSRTFEFTQALHSYFNIGNINNINITGLEDASYFDKVNQTANNIQEGPISFNNETDRIYQSMGSCTLIDPDRKRKIKVSKAGSYSTVIWNPWKTKSVEIKDMADDGYLSMVCIEAANTAFDSISLTPGSSHVLSQIIEIEAI